MFGTNTKYKFIQKEIEKIIFITLFMIIPTGFSQAQDGAQVEKLPDPAMAKQLIQNAKGKVTFRTKAATNVVNFVSVSKGGDLLPGVVREKDEDKVMGFFNNYGSLFGIKSVRSELTHTKSKKDQYGFTSVSYQQSYNGVPVFGSFLRGHLDKNKNLTVVNGSFIPNIKVDHVPSLSAARAQDIAFKIVVSKTRKESNEIEGLKTSAPVLYVYRTNLTRGIAGANYLVYEVEVSNGTDVREFVYVDAHTGKVVDQITGIHHSINRRAYDGGFGPVYLVWSEGDTLPYGVLDIDNIINFAEDTYNLFASMTNGSFLSWDGVDGIMHTANDDPAIPCPNAQWTGSYTRYCTGVTGDDTVGHEWGHAYTQSTHNLIYAWQSGALNESYSDIWGEVVDFLNGAGTDSPGGLRSDGNCSIYGIGSPSVDNTYRWLSGEDDPAFGGAIRDMWTPTCYNDPGKVSDSQYWCLTSDGGGVHTNSGVPNHAFALIVDGGTYNGQTITGIGLTKAAHIYWRAQATYQGPASDFAAHADALEQSCSDLIGANLYALDTNNPTGTLSGEVISAADCGEVTKAVLAAELRTPPTQCGFTPLLNPVAPAICAGGPKIDIHANDWESGLSGWTVGTRAVVNPATFSTPDWAVVSPLPSGRAGSAAFVNDALLGNCADDIEAGVLYLESPDITIPDLTSPDGPAVPQIAFDHWVATERGYDGGNVKISVNGGPWTLLPSSAFIFNAYNQALNPFPNDNPLAGEGAFTGSDEGSLVGSWGQSQIDLTGFVTSGDTVRIRYEMGLDGCNGLVGWYVDDVQVYACEVVPEPPSECTVYTSTDVPKAIPVGVASISSVLNVSGSDTIIDINVLNLNGTHTYINDLDFSLQSPSGTNVQIMAQSCLSEDNFDLNLDDEAAPGPWPCPPIGGGTYRPVAP